MVIHASHARSHATQKEQRGQYQDERIACSCPHSTESYSVGYHEYQSRDFDGPIVEFNAPSVFKLFIATCVSLDNQW